MPADGHLVQSTAFAGRPFSSDSLVPLHGRPIGLLSPLAAELPNAEVEVIMNVVSAPAASRGTRDIVADIVVEGVSSVEGT